ncbi:TonB-dependent receptor [Runella zeae]|uniref:TonB-dependent receptor n=1 Tax=Runella zeae TaxID=94255 RepID=UPI000402C194|nr:TonB-dependent receptor [Runella zeae]
MNRLFYIWAVWLGLFTVDVLLAQSPQACDCLIKGTVKDRETGQAIVGAILIVEGTNRNGITDAEGRYKIDKLCQGNYTIECKIIGYKTVKASVSLVHSAEEDINLTEEEVHLQDVEITAHRVQSSLSQKTISLEGKALEQNQGQTLGDALKVLNGVTLLQTGASIAKPVIHGLHSNRILIMNNGIRQEGQQWGSEHAPEIDPFVAKRVTVVQGASGVRYGSDAIGGVILVEPDELPKHSKISGEANMAAFSNGRMGVISGTLQGGIANWKGWAWRIQGTLKNGGNIRTPDYFLANTGVKEHNFSLTAGYRNAKVGAEIFYSQFHTNIGIFSGSHIGSTSDLLNVIKNGEPFIKADFEREIERPNQLINHDLLKGKAFYNIGANRLTWTFGRQFNRRAEYDLHGPQAATKPALLFRLTTYTSDLIFEHAPIKGAINGQIGLSGLYQYNFTDGRPLIPDFDQTNIGMFLIERWVRNQWELEAGLRYDWRKLDIFKFVGSALSPRQHQFSSWSGTLGSVWNATEALSMRVNLGSAWRPPSPNELYSKGVHHGAAAYEEGNDQMQPETAYNLIGSIDYNRKQWQVEVGVYHNLIQNYIYLKPQAEPILTVRGAFPYFKYVQTNASFTGVDVDTRWEIIPKKLTHTAKISYLKAYDLQEKGYLVLIPANRIENTLKYNWTQVGKWENLYLSLTHLWAAQQKRVPPNSDFVDPPAAYHLWSVLIGGDWNKSIGWSLTAQNLLDAAYRDYLNRFRYYSLEQGRNISLRIKWNF